MHIKMHSDDINKIEVRNVEKYLLLAAFYEVLFSIFIRCPNRIKIGHHM